jgi:hypothetical protein
MSWKKYFKVVDANSLTGSVTTPTGYSQADVGFKNYQSVLPEVYTGHPNRIDRYNQYETMDGDSEINAALDILSEFSTQTNVENHTAFDIFFKDQPSDTEVQVIREALFNWISLNDFDRRIFKIFRNTIKYGDQIFIRDPETFQWYWVDNADVVKVIVNESAGKEPEQYVLKNINVNLQNLSITQPQHSDLYTGKQGGDPTTSSSGNVYNLGNHTPTTGSRFSQSSNEIAVDAKHVVHISLTEGLDPNWPFGVSVLESVFKVYKQKELLEDAIIIYRVQRAPERRVFYIDVGNMPAHMAMGYVNRVKNEIHQRRIPTQSGGGTSMMDATYNPLSINEDYFFPQTAEGRGSKVDTLPGGTGLGEIDDLKYFTNKLFRGLRIPSSYLPTGSEDGSAGYVDGRVGTALIQEYRFNQYCKRLQASVASTFDFEFKMFLNWKGYNIDSSMFELRFNEPQNFAAYRQAEIDSQRASLFQGLAGTDFLSKRFLLKRFLGLSEEEMTENDRLWAEENGTSEFNRSSAEDLRSVGVTPGDLNTDFETLDAETPDIEGGDVDIDVGGDEGGEAPEAGTEEI